MPFCCGFAWDDLNSFKHSLLTDYYCAKIYLAKKAHQIWVTLCVQMFFIQSFFKRLHVAFQSKAFIFYTFGIFWFFFFTIKILTNVCYTECFPELFNCKRTFYLCNSSVFNGYESHCNLACTLPELSWSDACVYMSGLVQQIFESSGLSRCDWFNLSLKLRSGA